MSLFKKDTSVEVVPTKGELDVLQVLWQYGPSTVRFVHDKLNEQKEAVIYTSTLKLMQVMKEKGMLDRDESSMKHVYSAVLEEKRIKSTMLNRFVDSMYNGSPADLIVALLGNDKTSPEEIDKVKELLKKMDSK
ncbi:Predicted transcriptional regulator [Filimonas lacunae]|uniref:Predicted transcriptional regulator n=1 Tax=Filimonas lacunae TaxID=477680 RepID=A0A173MDB9_9BACT|nr:BlaI/MecI/CopY family transcriptional regulator [Filimonas lacunae]BAV05584.1 transcriptional repressor, BlaI/MecI family [Filimonas lacunae]SIT29291.1 Predicted transcriptional regulator [Filimonas lacunae]